MPNNRAKIKTPSILEIDDCMTKLLASLKQHVKTLEFTEVACFTLSDSVDLIKKQLDSYKDKKGVYFFEIENDVESKSFDMWYEIFKKNYYQCCIKNTPKIVDTKANKFNGKNLNWIPLYIGKSQDLNKRVIEHLELKDSSETYSMKLLTKKSLLKTYKFRISVIEFDVKNYAEIGSAAERFLREKYNPIVGSARS